MTTAPRANDPQAISEAQRCIWNSTAASYPSVTAKAGEPLLDAAGVGEGTLVLDVACGPGLVAAAAAARGALVTGLDFAEDMVEEARSQHPSIKFRVGDAAALPFDDEAYDALVIGFGIFLMAEPQKVLEEAKRVLKPGGRVAFTIWDAPETLTAFSIVFGTVGAHIQPEPAEPPPLLGKADEGLLTGVVTEAGFVDATFERLPLVWELPSADALFEAFRSFPNLAGASDDVLKAIRSDILSKAAEYERDGELHLPMPAILVSGVRP